MPSTFPGFSPKALSFLRQLERNNRREWFQPRKDVFDRDVRGPVVELVALVNDDLRSFAAEHVTEPAQAIYRIYRDTRFSKDKTPYKTHIAASFLRRGLPKHAVADFYFAVSHKHVEIAGGMYMPGPEELSAVRCAIARDDGKKLQRLIDDQSLRRALGPPLGHRLARLPKGFDPRAGSPAAELLKFKQMYFYVTLDAKVATTSRLRREIVSRFRVVTPVINYLNDAILRDRKATAGRDAVPVRPAPMF